MTRTRDRTLPLNPKDRRAGRAARGAVTCTRDRVLPLNPKDRRAGRAARGAVTHLPPELT